MLLLLVLAGNLYSANSGLTALTCAMSDLCNALNTMLPVAAMLMLVMAGVIYASGQMMGAETRARANVWATACLTGALIGILIVVISPPILASVLGRPVACTPEASARLGC